MSARGSEGLLEVVCWWPVLVGIWTVTTTSVTGLEWAVAAVAALPCAVCAMLARRAAGTRWSLDPRWARWLLRFPRTVTVDIMRVACSTLPGAGSGELRELTLPSEETSTRSVTRRAVAALLVSATPGSYLVDSPDDRPALIVHALGPPGPLERAVQR